MSMTFRFRTASPTGAGSRWCSARKPDDRPAQDLAEFSSVENSAEQSSRPWFVRALRLVFALLAATALVLGFRGMQLLVPLAGWRYLVYCDLQLFVLGPTPFQDPHDAYSWPLEWARFLAPLATGYALVLAA